MMNYKEKAIEIATNATSIALGLILFLAILIGVPSVFVGLYFAQKVAVMAWSYMNTQHGDLTFYSLMFLASVAWIFAAFYGIRDAHLDKKKKEGDV